MNHIDTRSRILSVARELFASKGYDGTSIREIASQAEVNIAAINYHFKSKQNLYWNIFLDAHCWLAGEIESLVNQHSDFSELIWQIFSFMYGNSEFLRNSFMLMLSDSFPAVDEDVRMEICQRKEIGPPGGKFILSALTREVGDNVSQEMKHWAVETLFSHIIHWALLLSGSNCRELHADHPMFELEYRKKSFDLHVKAIVSYLLQDSKVQ